MRKICTRLKHVLALFAVSFFTVPLYSQAVLEDNFNRPDNYIVGNGWTETETVNPLGIQIINNFVRMGSNTTVGTEFLFKDFNTIYPTVFSSSPSSLTWAFNMGSFNANPRGFSAGEFGMAFILGCTSANPMAASGYAVLLGNFTAPHQVRLVRFTGSISNSVDIISTPSGYGVNGFSVRVVYNPTTNNWSFYLESSTNPSGSPQADPRNTSTLIGSAVDGSHTALNLRYMGAFLNHGNSAMATDYCIYDEIYRPQLATNSITTGTLPSNSFKVDCMNASTGSVDFSATGSFNASNVYTAQLSNASGSFAAPLNIGTLSSNANTGTINFTIPAGTPSGTLYRIRVTGSNPATIGSVSGNVTITLDGCVTNVTDYFRSKASGNWEDASTWESSHNTINWFPATAAPTGGGQPASIYVRTGHDVKLNSYLETNKINVESGGTLTLDNTLVIVNSSSAPEDMVINGTLTCISNGMLEVWLPANVWFRAGSIYNHQRNGGNMPSSVGWNDGATCNVTGITNTAPGKLDQSFGQFYWNCSGQTVSVSTYDNVEGLGDIFRTMGEFALGNTGSGAFIISKNQPGANYHDFGSIRVLNNGHLRFSESDNGNPEGVVSVQSSGIVSVEGNGKIDFGTGSGVPDDGGYYRSHLILGGDLELSSTATFSCSDGANYGDVRFSRNGTQTVNIATGAGINRLDYHILSGSTTIMQSNMAVYTYAADDYTVFTVEPGAVLDAGAAARITGTGYFELFGTLKSANSNGISSAGSLPVTNVLIDPASTIEYNSVSPQSFTSRFDYGNVIISGGGTKTLDGHAELSGQLFLNAGLVQLGDYYLTLTLAADAIPVFSANSYIVTNGLGGLERSVETTSNSYVFPIGTSANIQEFSLNFAGPVVPSNFLAARFIQGNGGSNGLPLTESGHTISQTSGSGYWEVIAESPLTQNYTGTFSAKGFTDILNYANLHLLKRPDAASPWILQGTHVPTSGSNSLAVLSRTGFSGFSQFAVGGQFGNILPVTILNFSGYKDGINNQLTWTTAEEVNNKGFEVQRSTDGINFQVIAFVNSSAPGGNSSTLLDYHFTDNNPGKLNQYYRLKQVDINGQNKFSNTVLIRSDMTSVVSINSIYPVPAKTSVNLAVESPYREEIKLVVTDMTGRMMIQKAAYLDEGANIISVDISRLTPGNYLVKLVGSRNNELAIGKLLKF